MLPFCIMAFLLVLTSKAAQASDVWPTPKMSVTKVRVHKAERKMELWINQIKLRTYRISLGSAPIGHKEKEGDGKTPEGNYILDFRKTDSVAYKAMHVSYPSPADVSIARAKGMKPGGSIMIHGNWNGYGWAGPLLRYFDWTNGCIGLTNADMDDIWTLLAWNTPIEILP